MKRAIRKLLSFSTAVVSLMNFSLISAHAEYTAETVEKCTYDELIQMRDKSILIKNGTDDDIGNETELVIIDKNGNKNVVSKDLKINSVYNYISTTMGAYNYICPTNSAYSFDYFDQSYRISTEQDAVIVGIDDKYALMNNNGEIVSKKYNNIYYSGNGYYVVDNADPDSVYDSDINNYTDNKSGLIKSDGTVVFDVKDGVMGYYITPDGEHFMVETETGDYFVDTEGNAVSKVFDEINVNDENFRGTLKYARQYNCTRDIYEVSLDGKQALMNQNFKVFTDYYDEINREGYFETGDIIYCYDGYVVTLDGKSAFINLSGKRQTDFYDELICFDKGNNWLCRDGYNITVCDKDFNSVGSVSMYDKIGEGEKLKSVYADSENGVATVSITIEEPETDDWGWNITRSYRYIVTSNASLLNIDNYSDYIILENSNLLVKDQTDSLIKLIDKSGNVLKTFDKDYTEMNLFDGNKSVFTLSTGSEFSVYDDDGNALYEHINGSYSGNNIYSDYQKYGFFTLESGVVTELIYNNASVYDNNVYIVETDNDVKVLSQSFEEIYSLESGYEFMPITHSDYYYNSNNSRITFNKSGTDGTDTVVYNYEKNEIEYQQSGIYDKVSEFINGYAIAYKYTDTDSSGDDLWTSDSSVEKCMIDITGKEIIPYSPNISEILVDFDSVTINYTVLTYDEINSGKDFCDTYGYNIASKLDENTYKVLLDGKWGLVSSENKVLLDIIYDDISDFTDGLAEITIIEEIDNQYYSNYYYGVTTIEGKIIVEPAVNDDNKHYMRFEDGTAYVADFIEKTNFNGCKNRYDFKDFKGAELLNDFCKKYGYDLARKEYDFYYVEKDGKAGIVTADNEIVIPVEYKDILSFNSSKYSLGNVQERFHNILTDEYTSKLRKTDNDSYLVFVRDDSDRIGIIEIKQPASSLGDVDGDKNVNASDASMILSEYASTSSGKPATLSLSVADVNSDGFIDASDASYVLAYYAYYSSGGSGTIQDFINKQ